jgi:hypothetical protein
VLAIIIIAIRVWISARSVIVNLDGGAHAHPGMLEFSIESTNLYRLNVSAFEVWPGSGYRLVTLLGRRARNALGTATQCTRRNDSPRGGLGGLRVAAVARPEGLRQLQPELLAQLDNLCVGLLSVRGAVALRIPAHPARHALSSVRSAVR